MIMRITQIYVFLYQSIIWVKQKILPKQSGSILQRRIYNVFLFMMCASELQVWMKNLQDAIAKVWDNVQTNQEDINKAINLNEE